MPFFAAVEVIGNKCVVYEFGKFVLDPRERTLLADGIAIHLRAKEFDTLLLLVEHNGHLLTKEQMMAALWQDSFVEESNLARQISQLRKIFNTDEEQFIETLPKHGYRFTAELRRTIVEPEDEIILEKRTVKRVTFGLENEFEPEPERLELPRARRAIFTVPRLAVLLIGVLGLVGVASVWFWNQRMRPASAQINTVAVLPLRSLNGDEDHKALGLGLTDALITKLASTRRFIVRPTNAVAPFANNADPVETGRRLNVDAVLEGTIQEADGRLRVNARLFKTATGEQIWAERFEQPSAGIFALQDALSANIAKTLDFELSKSDSDRMLHRGTESVEAYEKYLRGRFYQSQNTPDGLTRSIALFQQAAALDPNFAEAHAGIADANLILFNFGLRPAAETIPTARQAVNRALQLNAELSNAYTSLALIQFLGDRNWAGAEKSLQRAIELDPNNSDAFLRYGYFLTNFGRFDDALEKLSKARELNPLSPIVNANTGLAYLCARQYPQAIEQLERTAAENPEFPLPQWLLGTSYEAVGDADRSFAANLRALVMEGKREVAARLQKVKDTAGLEAANRVWLAETVKSRQPGKDSALSVALRAATVKDREQTLSWLEKAIDEGDRTIVGIKYLAKFDFVRDDPRFQAVANKLSF